MLNSALCFLARIFDSLSTSENTDRFGRVIIWIAILGLGFHLLLIWLSRTLEVPPEFLKQISTNFLSALYTPFSFILFYEVFLLVVSIPESITGSIARQYEIISLIILRDVFKDISAFENMSVNDETIKTFYDILLDMGGGLGMFLLVGIFYHIRKTLPKITPEELPQMILDRFIIHKKVVACLLALTLFFLTFSNLWMWLSEVYQIIFFAAAPEIDIKRIFYVDLFTVMIFTDVLILLLSMLYSDNYPLVLRNAGFVVSTILIRFSLTISKPYNVELGLIAMVFGVLVLGIYSYFVNFVSNPRTSNPR